MKYGAYESFSKTRYAESIREAVGNGEQVMMVFIGSPRATCKLRLCSEDIIKILKARSDYGMHNMVVHAAYTASLASSDEGIRERAVELIKIEIENAELIGASDLVIHPGTSNIGLINLEKSIRELLRHFGDSLHCKIVIEGMAGKGGEVFCTVNDWVELFSKFSNKEKEHLGICLDTCHFYDAGYDYVKETVETANTINNSEIFKFIRVIHVNGSLNNCNSHKDRHACIYDSKLSKIPSDKIEEFIKSLNLREETSIIIECTSDEFPGYMAAERLKKAVENDMD